MAGFNYGGQGDGTGWSSESGSGPAPGGGGHGNAGDHNSSSSGGNSSDGGIVASVETSKGDSLARQAGLDPAQFVMYVQNVDGNVIGLTEQPADNTQGVNLGPLPGSAGSGGGDGGTGGNTSVGGAYLGDTSDSRISELKKIIADNAVYANSTQYGRRIYQARQKTREAQRELGIINYTREDIANAVKFTTDFYQELTQKFSQNASQLAQEFAEQAKGKTLRNVDEALAAYERYKGSLGGRYSAQDRAAIANALKSIQYSAMAEQLAKYSKGLGYYGKLADSYDLLQEVIKAFETDQWRPVFVKIETLTAGKVATGLVAFSFTLITGVPLGIVSFALLMALTGAMVNDDLMNSINAKLGL